MGEDTRKTKRAVETEREMDEASDKMKDEQMRLDALIGCKASIDAIKAAKKEKDEAICKKMAEIAEMNNELGKTRCRLRQVDDVLFEVFNITHASSRSPSDLKGRIKTQADKLRHERDKAIAQIERDRAKIGELLNEIDCKRMELPPEEPIGAAAWLINAKQKREKTAIQKLLYGPKEYEDYDVYSVSDLREIAEHLLAYCKNNGSEACASEGGEKC